MALHETSISAIKEDGTALWYSNYLPDIRKMEKMLKENPNDAKIIHDYRNETGEAYGLEIEIPIKWFRMPKATAKKQFSAEHKAKLKENLAAYRYNAKKNIQE